MSARTVGRKRRSTTRLRWARSLVAVLTLAVAVPLLGTVPPAAAITDPVQITSPPPPATATTSPYGPHQFSADGPVGNWRVRSGSLPPGLALDPVTGVIAGTPTQVGVFGPITVGATDRRPTFDADFGMSCGLRLNGSVRCWGHDLTGQNVDQPGPYTTIATGEGHSCGLRPDGSAHCWGDNSRGQSNGQTGPYTAISAGGYYTCGLRTDGAAHCWGDTTYGRGTSQPGPYIAISAAAMHTCGLRPDGSAHCWGDNRYGQSNDHVGPYTTISAAHGHTCALRPDGSAHCWGNGTQAANQPGPYTAISAGTSHTCGLRPDGEVHCWGRNEAGQSSGHVGPFTAIASGYDHSCGVRADRSVACWGGNSYGERVPKPGRYLDGIAVSPQTFTIEVISSPPVISPVDDQTVDRDGTTGPLSFIVGDQDDLPRSLVVTAASSDQSVVPDAGVALAGTGALRTVTVTPAPGAVGTARITLTVTDPQGLTASTSFAVHVVGDSTSLDGTVTIGGAGVDGVIVAAFEDGDGFSPTTAGLTGSDGTYVLADLAPGTFRLAYLAPSGSGTSITWWSDSSPTGTASRATATPIRVTSAPDAITGLDIDLVPAAAVSGTVTGTAASPLAGVSVRAWAPTDTWLPTASTTTQADGSYTLAGLPAGDYRIQFVPAPDSLHQPVWHAGATTAATATVLTLVPGQHPTGIDAQLAGTTGISGTVVDSDDAGIAGASVLAFRDTNRFMPSASATTRADGSYTLTGLPAGTYRLQVVPADGSGLQSRWHGGTTRATATPFTLASGDQITDLRTTLSP